MPQKNKMEYTLVYSSRKTLAIQITREGKVTVRAPGRMKRTEIEKFILDKQEWILEKSTQARQRMEEAGKWMCTPEEREAYIERARIVLPAKTAYYAKKMGVDYGRMTIRSQRTVWGSCSSKGNLSYNWQLMHLPEELIDYVVVHELAHRKEMNHSSRFYEAVAFVLPDYRERMRRLKAYTIAE